jgi:hypothetical protein
MIQAASLSLELILRAVVGFTYKSCISHHCVADCPINFEDCPMPRDIRFPLRDGTTETEYRGYSGDDAH